MSEKKDPIPAVLYLRKSTKGMRKGKESQEKSLPQQRKQLLELAAREGYEIVREYADPGVSGWKSGAKRPDFERMLNDAEKRREFQLILCDDLDRFSRSEVGEVHSYLYRLHNSGVRWIHCANQGKYETNPHDPGQIFGLAAGIFAGNEFSRKLGRRIALARRNKAKEGKLSGGPAPYGLKLDGKGGLIHGDKGEVKIVKRIFDEFVNGKRSLGSIAAGLNADGFKGPRGNMWFTRTVRHMITQVNYRGDFQFGATRQGRFYTMSDEHDVVPANSGRVYATAKDKRIVREGVYKPLIDPKLFDAAQRRLATLSTNRSARKRVGYALTGVIVCDHCGRPCYGVKTGNYTVYRCGSNSLWGKDGCGNQAIREDVILPFVMKLLSQEVESVEKLLTSPPERLRQPQRENLERREQIERELADLDRQILIATKNLLTSTEDARTRRDMDAAITEMRNERQTLAARLDERPRSNAYSREEWKALKEWWKDFSDRAVSMRLPTGKLPHAVEAFFQDPMSEERALLLDPRVVNATLMDLGAEVRLRWDTEKMALRKRYTVSCGRFRLGQQKGRLPQSVLGRDECIMP